MNFFLMIICATAWGMLMHWLLPAPWYILASCVGGVGIGIFFAELQ